MATGTLSLEQSIQQLTAARDGYLIALAQDAVNPQANYNLEGQSVSRESWRDNMQNGILKLNAILTQFEPIEINSIQI